MAEVLTRDLMFMEPQAPSVSVLLPTYNRSRFLRQAFQSICDQTHQDWELIVVDDGSTDDTKDLVAAFARTVHNSVRYAYQSNQGPYGARNAALSMARGEYVAFFDSDDVWLPHHLTDCVAALEANPEVDWVYGACRMVHYATERVIASSTFYGDGKPIQFMKLRIRASGRLRIIEDSRVIRCMFRYGLACGLQNSVVRRSVFKEMRFCTHYRNEAEDQLTLVKALASGHRLAYYDNVHVIYNVHEGNSSAATRFHGEFEKTVQVLQGVVRGYEDLLQQVTLTNAERRALRRRLGRHYFWQLGYAGFWQHGRRPEALAMFRRGLRFWPWDLRCAKTYLLARLRTIGEPGCRTDKDDALGMSPPCA